MCMCVCVCVCMCVCAYAYINISLYVIRKWYRVCLEATYTTNSYRIRIRNSLKSRIRIRDRIRKKSFRIHNTASYSTTWWNFHRRLSSDSTPWWNFHRRLSSDSTPWWSFHRRLSSDSTPWWNFHRRAPGAPAARSPRSSGRWSISRDRRT